MDPGFVNMKRTGHRKFSIRGKVIKHITKSKGWWIFKTEYGGLLVQLNTEQVELHRKRYGEIHMLDIRSEPMKNQIEVFLPDEMMKSFPVDTEVGATFAQGSPLEQFFQGASPIELIDFVKLSETSRLVDELLPVQLSLV